MKLNEVNDLINVWDHRARKWHTITERQKRALIHRGEHLMNEIGPLLNDMHQQYFAKVGKFLKDAAFDKDPDTGYITIRLGGEGFDGPPSRKNATVGIWYNYSKKSQLSQAVHEMNNIVLLLGSEYIFHLVR